ncbi:ribosomal RNA-processing protein [Chloropicon primus]|uniref:Ribosomal RNA-processing protein n=1 Tax=Chloropicon primus TaxID=1764295 RepID=A0A5B8MSQ9_9CHLO|nr:Ribosomal RNA-processing protein [Chloropicon primus]UPR02593.1 ribosomal RNA-processing protein [Chloropicon primus]|eukprot:QDZ23381.1 Ribosomal RNA-processing protein [Chloropicon primus]
MTKRKRKSREVTQHLRIRLKGTSFVRLLIARSLPKVGDGEDDGEGMERRERTVLLNGVPEGMTSEGLCDGFGVFGNVEGCVIHKDKKRKTGIVVFEKAEARDAVLSDKAEGMVLDLEDGEQGGGRDGAYGLVMEYRRKRPGNEVLLERVNTFIEEKEAEEEEERRAREAAAAGDGWTVVRTRKGARHKNQDGSGVNLQAVSKVRAESNRKEASLHQGFYHFQRREQRRNEILELQSKFKEDKKRIAELRSKRKFNPYQI